MRKERILEIERLRGMAFLAVVMQHSIAHYSVAEGMTEPDGILMAVLLMATKFAVPAFIFITGMVLFYNDSGQLQYGNFVKRRISDIYIPFAIWTIIHVAINGKLHLDSMEGWTELGSILITGKASSHLWYIIMLFQFYLLYPVYRSVVRGISNRLTHRVNVILLVATGVLFIVMTAYISDIGRFMGGLHIPVWSELFTVYADRNALNFSFYFILGAAAGMNPEMWSKWIHRARPVYWTIFVFMFGFLLMQGINEIRLADGARITFYSLSLLRPWMALFLISSILAMYDLAGWICRRSGRSVNAGLSSLGLYSFGAYLMHLLTLRISYLLDESLMVSTPSLIRIISSWIISVALAYMGARLFALMPFGKWLAGVPGGRGRKQAVAKRELNTSVKM
ncbi:Surface polysaccharide O-acyltransferase, integral membrane enzyme [Paenibacillus uliginis N3/975]|uniref:Surface polysaccharide O-acyltransferase, integral membrane enzyme n=1 Tax=Paenibacillus uliginis N3/975 TaxID=1313296 RepID=A0A1X7H9M8_9BACL|nr:acyltransferase [Paenibacillus uliginis]SMF82270.1 Surface polysaccharide O-acyltransferase, integral membrane enzyme [Paenibacillus uliginis N3/975]